MARLHPSFSPILTKEVSIDPAEVAAGAATNQTFTVSGLRLNYPVHVEMHTNPAAGLIFSGWYCSAADTLSVRIANITAAPINQAAVTIQVMQF